MNELKTLLDFEWWTAPDTNRSLSVEGFRLKQEAIKQVKILDKILSLDAQWHKEKEKTRDWNIIKMKKKEKERLTLMKLFELEEEYDPDCYYITLLHVTTLRDYIFRFNNLKEEDLND